MNFQSIKEIRLPLPFHPFLSDHQSLFWYLLFDNNYLINALRPYYEVSWVYFIVSLLTFRYTCSDNNFSKNWLYHGYFFLLIYGGNKKKQPSQSAHKCSYSELWEKIIENLLKCLVKFMSSSSGRGFYYFLPQFHYTFYLKLFLQILFCTSMLQNHEIPFLPVSFSFWKWDNQTYTFHVYKSCVKLCKKFAKIPLMEAL